MAQPITEKFAKERKKVIADSLKSNLHGRRIYLIGTAEYGPVNEPVLIKSSVGLHNTFGKQGTLIKAFHALKYVSRNNQTYLVKTTGDHARLYLNVNVYDGEVEEDAFIIAASEGREIYNDVRVLIDLDRIIITYPEELNVPDHVYKYTDYPTIGILADAINKETNLKKNKIYAYYSVEPDTPTECAFYVCNPIENFLYGGENGLDYSKDMLYNCLDRTYELLESMDIDIVVPVGAFMDDVYPNDKEETEYQYGEKYYHSTKDYLTEDVLGNPLSYMDQLINFCIRQLNFGMVTTGILGFNRHDWHTSDYLYEADHIAKMYKACFDYNLKCCLNPYYSFLVSVVAGDIRYNKGTIVDNGYLAYAALCGNISIIADTSNVPISDTIAIHQEFTQETLQKLAETGIVVYRHSPLYDQPVVYAGVTASPTNENLKLYANVRMIQLCISYINRLFQFYIGHNLTRLIKEDIITKDLHSMLQNLKSRDIITRYDFAIRPYYASGEVKVYLNLLTNYMVKAVGVSSTINVEYEEDSWE